MIQINFLTIGYVRVFDCKIVQGDFERALIELGHFDIVSDLKRKKQGVYELRGSDVVRSKIASRLADRLIRKGLVSIIYRDMVDSCYFMDVEYIESE